MMDGWGWMGIMDDGRMEMRGLVGEEVEVEHKYLKKTIKYFYPQPLQPLAVWMLPSLSCCFSQSRTRELSEMQDVNQAETQDEGSSQ